MLRKQTFWGGVHPAGRKELSSWSTAGGLPAAAGGGHSAAPAYRKALHAPGKGRGPCGHGAEDR